MRVVDLHPEDLLEKDALGRLEDGERGRLEAHLAHCAPCRLERQLRLDFAAELEAELPMEHLTAGLHLEMPAPVAAPRNSTVLLRAPRRRRTRAVWLLAAAALLVGGVAAAAMGLTEKPWPRLVGAASASADVSRQAASPVKPHRTLASAVAAVDSADRPEVDGVAASEPNEAPAPALLAAPARPSRAATPASVGPARMIGPGELFDSEGEARRQGDYGRALDVGRELETRYPASHEAQVSRAIVGRLLLDRGDPAGALAKFDSYLAAGAGQLGEEAMVGRATALDRLGRTDEAQRAWSALVATHPETPYAAHARARLESSNSR